jgi:predicted acylesterase/phospholipase RssA
MPLSHVSSWISIVAIIVTLIGAIVSGMYTAGKLVSQLTQHEREIRQLEQRIHDIYSGERPRDLEADRRWQSHELRLDNLEREVRDRQRRGIYP